MRKLKADISQVYTVEQVKAMDINTLVDKLEEKLGRKLDGGTLAWLAIAKGAGTVHAINLGTGESGKESINWEGITELLNGPAKPPLPPYEGPLVEVDDQKHFTEAVLFALQHSPVVCDLDENTGRYVRRPAPIDSLLDGFMHLFQVARNYAKNGWHFRVFPDFVPHSFGFACYDAEGKFVYNGGLILHKPWNSKEGRYEENTNMCWNIHT